MYVLIQQREKISLDSSVIKCYAFINTSKTCKPAINVFLHENAGISISLN